MKRITWTQIRAAFFYWLLVVILLMAANACAKPESVQREDCYCSPDVIFESEPCRTVCGAIL